MAKTNKGRKFFATTATAALVASAIVPVASAAQVNDFNSIASYAQEAVQDLVDRGVVQGDANGNFQPRKSVSRAEAATILSGALGLTTTEAIYFTDVKSGAWYYDAINAAVNNGVFSGKGEGKFDPNGNLTRGEAAVILVNAFNLSGKAPLAQFADEKSVKEWAKESLEIAVGNGVIKGDNGRVKANDAITKQDFAVMYSRAEEAADLVAASTVKAINATTVEVTFAESIKDIKALDFAIEGLEVKNAVVKQTDAKTAVLTTAVQEGAKEYTVTVNGEKVGKFTGIAAVIPTAISVVEASQQGILGQQVTVKAQVTVAEGQSKAGIPVTFNVTGTGSLNSPQLHEATTDENGVATYTYTRYANTTDDVVAYATGDRTKFSNGKVYWAASKQLTIAEITTGAALDNGAKKVYEINSAKNANGYVFVTFAENLNVTPDKAVTTVRAEGLTTYIKDGSTSTVEATASYPYQYSTGGTAVVAVKLDNAGKANLVLTGSNASATPIVFEGDYTLNTAGNFVDVPAYKETLLQAAGSTVKFELKQNLGLTIQAAGVQNAATYKNATETGGRDYTVTYTDQNGKVSSPGTTVNIALPVTRDANGVINDIKLLNANGDLVSPFSTDAKHYYYSLTIGAKGQVKFTVASTKADTYTAPVVFINNGNDLTATTLLDANDQQSVGEITYFVKDIAYSAALKVLNAEGKPVSSLLAGTDAKLTYQLVDQNGKPRAFDQATNVAFQVTAGTSPITVAGTPVLAGRTATVNGTIAAHATQTQVLVKAETPTAVTATATGSRAGVVLPTTDPATVTINFTQYGTTAITGLATGVNTDLDVLTINTVLYSYDGATYQYNSNVITKAAFENYIKNNGATVSVTVDTEGKFTFNVIATTVPTKTPQDLVNEEAAKITTAPAIADNKLVLPTVPAGYTVAVKSSSDEAVIKLDGTVVPAETAKTVDVVLEVTKATGEKAVTQALTVTVPAKETEVEGVTLKDLNYTITQNGITLKTSILLKADELPEALAGKTLSIEIDGTAVEFTPNPLDNNVLRVVIDTAKYTAAAFDAKVVTAK